MPSQVGLIHVPSVSRLTPVTRDKKDTRVAGRVLAHNFLSILAQCGEIIEASHPIARKAGDDDG